MAVLPAQAAIAAITSNRVDTLACGAIKSSLPGVSLIDAFTYQREVDMDNYSQGLAVGGGQNLASVLIALNDFQLDIVEGAGADSAQHTGSTCISCAVCSSCSIIDCGGCGS